MVMSAVLAASADPTTWLITQGVLGIVLACLAPVTWKLYTELRVVQEQRVVEAKEVAKTLLEVTESFNRTTNDLTLAIRELTFRIRGNDGGE